MECIKNCRFKTFRVGYIDKKLSSPSLFIIYMSSREICQPLCKNTAGVRCKMQFAYYLQNPNSFHRCSEFCLFDELFDADK